MRYSKQGGKQVSRVVVVVVWGVWCGVVWGGFGFTYSSQHMQLRNKIYICILRVGHMSFFDG